MSISKLLPCLLRETTKYWQAVDSKWTEALVILQEHEKTYIKKDKIIPLNLARAIVFVSISNSNNTVMYTGKYTNWTSVICLHFGLNHLLTYLLCQQIPTYTINKVTKLLEKRYHDMLWEFKPALGTIFW